MENYIVSARKYRPMSFSTVVGQASLTTTLKNAVKSGKLAHAYLFCGPRGVGKTTCARIFAKAINCQHPTDQGEACNECESCSAFNDGRSYNIFELDAASNNSVENIKQLMEQTRIPPQVGRYKVFIIDEVHMLSTAAFNAFLKTLEEPPSHVIFILATTEKHKILPTIISRCQIYDFERMTVQETIDHLKQVAEKEGYTYEEQALGVIAEKADGGMRDALSIFDQAASYCQGDITYQKVIEDLNELDVDTYFRLVDMAMENRVTDIMLLLDSVIGKGFDSGNLINGLASHIRNVLMAKDEQTIRLLETSQQQSQKYAAQAQKCPVKFLYAALKLLNQCDLSYRQSSNKRLLVELTLIQVAQITQPDEGDSAGRSPKRLKILFKLLQQSRQPQAAVQQVTAGGNALRQGSQAALATLGEQQPSAHMASEPAPQPAVSALGGTRLKLGKIGITFASLKQKQQETAQSEPEVTNKDENEQFSEDALELEWLSMCNRMPQMMTGLAQRMKNIRPTITTFPDIEIVADNQPLLDDMERIRGRIRATLAKGLHNGQIGITLRLAKATEIKKILTKREILDEMRQKNPAIDRFCQSLKLELA